jgi:hypothetical protein
MSFQSFQERLKTLRSKADEYADAKDIHASLDTVEKAWESASQASSLLEVPAVKNAVLATTSMADEMARCILFSDVAKVSPESLIRSVIVFQTLERLSKAFSPIAAQAMEDAVASGLERKDD